MVLHIYSTGCYVYVVLLSLQLSAVQLSPVDKTDQGPSRSDSLGKIISNSAFA